MNLGQEQQQLPLLTLQQQQQKQLQHHNHHNHHQQQYYQQQQQQQNTSMALMSSGEYVNFKPINTIATTIATSAESAQEPIPLSNTALCTEMTIPMDLPTPPLSETLVTPFQAVLSTTAPEITTNMQTPLTTNTFETMGVMTSSFKTPLLPMPTLEDIEDGVIYDQQKQQQQQQQIIQTSQIPTGILKYPTMPATTLTQSTLITQQHTSQPVAPPVAAATTTTTINTTATIYRNTAELNLPLGLVADCASSTVVSHDVATLTTTAPTAIIGGTRHKYGALKTTADINNRSISSSCTSEIPISDVYAGIVKSTMPTVTTAIPTTTTIATETKTTIPSSTTTITAQGLRLKSSGAPSTAASASNAKLSQHQHSTRGTYCCACFAKNPNDTHSTSDAKTKKRKRRTQTLWSAFITNVGICALLLAYTFLGAFIFLTIEGEDLYQQQRTLASTKRTVAYGAGGRMLNTSGRRDNKASPGNDVGHVYAAPPQQHIDNGTLSYGGYVATSATDSTSAASTLEGVVMAINANGETVYGWDADSDDSNSPQMALSAQTSDVRQRTIENIWDITVSLNILYKENWTKLAAMEIAKFQDQLVKRLNEDAMLHYYAHDGPAGAGNRHSPATEAVLLHSHNHLQHEWNFAKAFFYALTVLTTIGYGHIAPRTTLSRMVTLLYAIFGIPLTLVYLSSTGGILAKVAREVFSKALCCCLCSNCGYCCYDEKRMAEKERRMKRKRQQEELRKQQAGMQEPYYVRTGSGIDNFQLPDKIEANTPTLAGLSDIDSLSVTESHGSMHGLSILAPIILCLSMMVIYIAFGAVMLYHLENWPLIDGVYFCFMSLSTIGFGDMLPGMGADSDTTTWFCSIYIMSGMALTAMCFNVIHDEIVHRIKIVVEFKKNELTLESDTQQSNYYAPP